MKFYPLLTNDGSISLYNTEVDDIYHSSIGAYTEALNKYTIPSGITEYCKQNNEVSILDTCYGLGYNSRVSITEILKINPACKINLCMLENDPYVLAYSLLVNIESESEVIIEALKSVMLSSDLVRQAINDILNDVTFKREQELDLKLIKQLENIQSYNCKSKIDSKVLLHNIYYPSQSISNKIGQNIQYKSDSVNIDLWLCDARYSIQQIKPYYNFVFHDPFTPSKVPVLWTVDFFSEYKRIISDNGNITTYSSNSAIRNGMLEAGLYIGKTRPVGRKTSGTIAYKHLSYLINELNNLEKGLLDTKSAIPYRDKDFSLTNQEIINNRQILVNNSCKISASKHLRVNKICQDCI